MVETISNKRSQSRRGRPRMLDHEVEAAVNAGQAVIREAQQISGLTLEALATAFDSRVGISPTLMRQYSSGLKVMSPKRLLTLARQVERNGWAGQETRIVIMAAELWMLAGEAGLPRQEQGMSLTDQARAMAQKKLLEAVATLADIGSPQQVVFETLNALYRIGAITTPSFAGIVDDGSCWLSVEVKPLGAVTQADLGTQQGQNPSNS